MRCPLCLRDILQAPKQSSPGKHLMTSAFYKMDYFHLLINQKSLPHLHYQCIDKSGTLTRKIKVPLVCYVKMCVSHCPGSRWFLESTCIPREACPFSFHCTVGCSESHIFFYFKHFYVDHFLSLYGICYSMASV